MESSFKAAGLRKSTKSSWRGCNYLARTGVALRSTLARGLVPRSAPMPKSTSTASRKSKLRAFRQGASPEEKSPSHFALRVCLQVWYAMNHDSRYHFVLSYCLQNEITYSNCNDERSLPILEYQESSLKFERKLFHSNSYQEAYQDYIPENLVLAKQSSEAISEQTNKILLQIEEKMKKITADEIQIRLKNILVDREIISKKFLKQQIDPIVACQNLVDLTQTLNMLENETQKHDLSKYPISADHGFGSDDEQKEQEAPSQRNDEQVRSHPVTLEERIYDERNLTALLSSLLS